MNTSLWISAGEVSGDMHGSLLLKALQKRAPSLSYMGMGGEHLADAGLETLFRTEDLSVMGITEVLEHLPRIFLLLREIKATLAKKRPAAVIVIDAPDFHFRVIAAARSLSIPVYYYISPKLWAWRQGRAEFLRKNVRRIISVLPFEQEFYRRFGVDVDYVGNPLVDVVNYPALSGIAPTPGLVGFLPGSRESEIKRLFPEFGKAARILRQRLPHLTFACAKAPGIRGGFLRSYWPGDVPITIEDPENRWEFMRRCEILIAASGTVTLESAIAGTPTIATYKVSPVSYMVGKMMIKVPYVSLANLIMDKEVFPELLQERCDAVPLADKALSWLLPQPGTDPLAEVRGELDEVRRRLGAPGAPERAADLILEDLGLFRLNPARAASTLSSPGRSKNR